MREGEQLTFQQIAAPLDRTPEQGRKLYARDIGRRPRMSLIADRLISDKGLP